MTERMQEYLVENADLFSFQKRAVDEDEAMLPRKEGEAPKLKPGYSKEEESGSIGAKYYAYEFEDDDIKYVETVATIGTYKYTKKIHFWIKFWSIWGILGIIVYVLFLLFVR